MVLRHKVLFINFSLTTLLSCQLITGVAQIAPTQQRVLGQTRLQQQQTQPTTQNTQNTQSPPAAQNTQSANNANNINKEEHEPSSQNKEIYKCDNSKTGGILYTDNPQNNINCIKKTVEPLRTIQTLQTDTQNKISSNETNDKNGSGSEYTTFKTILPPDAAEGINAPGGLLSLSVSFEVEPTLDGDDKIQVLFDGKAYGQASNSTTATITKENLEPGPHTVSAEIIRKGQAIKTANAPTFHFMRNSLFNKNNRPKGKP